MLGPSSPTPAATQPLRLSSDTSNQSYQGVSPTDSPPSSDTERDFEMDEENEGGLYEDEEEDEVLHEEGRGGKDDEVHIGSDGGRFDPAFGSGRTQAARVSTV
jgi:hypothetical protein